MFQKPKVLQSPAVGSLSSQDGQVEINKAIGIPFPCISAFIAILLLLKLGFNLQIF